MSSIRIMPSVEAADLVDATRGLPSSADHMGFAVQRSRRELGMTISDLAGRADVPTPQVVRLELGEPVPREAATAILAAAGLDPLRWMGGLPPGPLPVSPLDDRHGQVLSYLGEATAGWGDWTLFPDVSALLAHAGWPEAGQEAVVGRQGRRASWLLRLAFASCLCMGFAEGVFPAIHDHVGGGFARLCAWAMLGSVGSAFLLVIDAYLLPRPVGGEAARSLAVRERADALRDVAYAVSARGLVTCALAEGRLDRRDYLASSVTSVEVVDEDEGHVTFRLGTLLGPVEMAWVPRVRDVIDVVTGWGAGTRVTSRAVLEGPQ